MTEYVETNRMDDDKLFTREGAIERIKELIINEVGLFDIDNYFNDDDIIECGLDHFGFFPAEDYDF
jgi:hypothetical protein